MTFSASNEEPQQSRQTDARNSALRLAGDPVLWLALLLGIAACLAIINHVPYVNGPTAPKQWQWPYRHREVFLRSCLSALWRLALGGILMGGVVWLLRLRILRGTPRRCGGLAALFCWGLYFVWTTLVAATPLGPAHLPRIIKSQTWTSYFTLAQWIDTGRRPALGETLERYAESIPELPLHASTHPPGLVVSSYGMIRLFKDHPALSAVVGNLYQKIGTDSGLVGGDKFGSDDVAAMSLAILAIAGGQLGAFPLFWLIRQAGLAERTAWVAAALWVHYPALTLMIPAFDVMYPTATLLCICFALRGFHERPIVWGAALAVAFMASITFTFTLLLLVPMICLMAVLELARRAGSLNPGAILKQASPRNPDGRRLWVLAGVVLGSCLLLDAALRYVFGIHLMQIFFAAVHNQNEVLLPKLNRTYRVWVFYNVWDFLLFAGMSLSVLALAWTTRTFRYWWRNPAMIVPAVAIFPLAVMAVDISHQLSAETARVWLFLAPGVVWAGAAELVRRSGESWRWVLGGLLLVQAAFIYACRTNTMLVGF